MGTEQEKAAYVRTLQTEIAFWGRKLGRAVFSSVYFGGGTPSLLSVADFETIFASLKKTFVLQDGAEITLEANPDSASSELLASVHKFGVNRLSLGIQSFDDEQLEKIGRRHSAGQAELAFRRARAAGFANIGLDFIWGLPGQSVSQWLACLRRAVELGAEHLSCYGLTLEENTPLATAVKAGRLVFPAEKEAARMFVQGGELLESHGYMQYEISNYARMGLYSRHNSGYWQQAEYLGLGPGAASTLGGRRWTNPSDLRRHMQVVAAGNYEQNAEIITPRIALHEMIMLSLRTVRGLDLKKYRELTGQVFCKRFEKELASLHARGLLQVRNNRLRLTRTGMLVSDAIIAHFLQETDLALNEKQAVLENNVAGKV